MAGLLRGPGGLLLRGPAGALTRDTDCCCCNCETDGPTANFSYTQTDDDPCTFDFTDESVAGTCGEIVSWLWTCGATTISTSQNPTGINMESVCGGSGPWDVTLTVTDSAGCEDSVVGPVACGIECGTCPDVLPPTVTVNTSGWANDECAVCTDFNGSHELAFIGAPPGGVGCRYEKILGDDCAGGGNTLKIHADLGVSSGVGKIAVLFRATLACDFIYRPASDPGDCRGTHELDIDFVAASCTINAYCNNPDTVEIIV